MHIPESVDMATAALPDAAGQRTCCPMPALQSSSAQSSGSPVKRCLQCIRLPVCLQGSRLEPLDLGATLDFPPAAQCARPRVFPSAVCSQQYVDRDVLCGFAVACRAQWPIVGPLRLSASTASSLSPVD